MSQGALLLPPAGPTSVLPGVMRSGTTARSTATLLGRTHVQEEKKACVSLPQVNHAAPSEKPSSAMRKTTSGFAESTGSSRRSSVVGPSSRPGSGHMMEAVLAEEPVFVRRKSIRNDLCDKLLEARLSSANPAAVAHTLLLGGRKTDGSGSRICTTRDRIVAVFQRYAHNGSICMGSPIMKAFSTLGHPYPIHSAVDDIIARTCGGRAVLDCDDFVAVVRRYEEKLRATLLRVFADHAQQGPDAMSFDLLQRALFVAGVPSMPGVIEELHAQLEEELQAEVDTVSYTMFEGLYQDVVARAGLTTKERDRMNDLFEAAEDSDGTIAEQEVVEALAWNEGVVSMVGGLGFIKALAAAVIRETQLGRLHLDLRGWMDRLASSPATLDRSITRVPPRATVSALLVAARIMHERLQRELQATMIDLDLALGQGVVFRPLQLVPVFEELGYLNATPSSIYEVMTACEFDREQPLTFDQVYALIFRFVCASGLTQEETHEIAVAFWKFSNDGSRMLDVFSVGGVIRWLGFQPSQFRIYCFAEEAALQEDAQLSLSEVTNLVAQFIRSSLSLIQKVFKRSQVTMHDMPQLLNLLGYEPTEEELADLLSKAGGDADRILDFAEFKRLERMHRKSVRNFMEHNSGCTPAEMARYVRYFKTHTEPKPGLNGAMYMNQKAMRDLLLMMFPDTALNRERHTRISQLVRDADIDGNGMFDFQEYIWFMRQTTDIMDRENLQAGLALKKQLGYTEDEVKQFRDLYQLSDSDTNGYIDADELCDIFGSLIEMDEGAEQELRQRFSAVDDGDGKLDFWEFLHFMRKIQDENWRNITAR